MKKFLNGFILFTLFFTAFVIHAGSFNFAKDPARHSKKLPIVYSSNYDISPFFGLEKLVHPFDGSKYSKIFNALCAHFKLNKQNFHEPQEISMQDLKKVHTQNYLDSLDSTTIAGISEVHLLSYLPSWFVQRQILKPMRYATEGTVLGAKLASEEQWAINLSGGYHHAKQNSGEGFCVYADIPLAIKKIWETKPDTKVLIIDLDAHQGNGTTTVLREEIEKKKDSKVQVFDVYGDNNYPYEEISRSNVKFNYPLRIRDSRAPINDARYLKVVDDGFEQIKKNIDSFRPDLIIYNAGTDIYMKDKLGGMQVTEKGIIERDAKVFDFALANKIPVLMVLSGGYTQESHQIISDSIKNLLEKVLPKYGINPITEQTSKPKK